MRRNAVGRAWRDSARRHRSRSGSGRAPGSRYRRKTGCHFASSILPIRGFQAKIACTPSPVCPGGPKAPHASQWTPNAGCCSRPTLTQGLRQRPLSRNSGGVRRPHCTNKDSGNRIADGSAASIAGSAPEPFRRLRAGCLLLERPAGAKRDLFTIALTPRARGRHGPVDCAPRARSASAKPSR